MDIDLFQPYDELIHNNHQVAQCAGGLIAYCDDPMMVPAADANHLREDDYVIGVVYRGVTRAYPLFIIDYYHIINDVISGHPVLLTSCERCQSGNMFDAMLDGKRMKFLAAGFYNAVLTMSERRGFIGETASQWIHYAGIAISGRYKGKFLKQIPAFHYTWQEWKELHPDTEVMLEPDNSIHPDARQDHGRDEYFCRPGMEIGSAQTIYSKLDDRYPENEMVLGLYADNTPKAYPLREVKKSGGIVYEKIKDRSIVIFAGPRPEQFTMAAYNTTIDGTELTFTTDGEYFIDEQTQSKWSVEGIALKGKLKGSSLLPVNTYFLRWHAWVYAHKHTSLYLFNEKLPIYPDIPYHGLNYKPFKSILDKLVGKTKNVFIEQAIPSPALPRQVDCGITIRVDGERLNLFLFQELDAAKDYIYLEGAIHYNMIIPRLGRKKAVRFKNIVLESDPDIQFDDRTQVCRLPDNQIQWSPFIYDKSLLVEWSGDKSVIETSYNGYFTRLLFFLKKRRYDIIDVGFLPQCQLYPGIINGISATIEGYRYAIFRCISTEHAKNFVTRFHEAVNFSELAFVCFPDKMHKYLRHETGCVDANEVDWPGLLKNEKFCKVMNKYKN